MLQLQGARKAGKHRQPLKWAGCAAAQPVLVAAHPEPTRDWLLLVLPPVPSDPGAGNSRYLGSPALASGLGPHLARRQPPALALPRLFVPACLALPFFLLFFVSLQQEVEHPRMRGCDEACLPREGGSGTQLGSAPGATRANAMAEPVARCHSVLRCHYFLRTKRTFPNAPWNIIVNN